MLGGNRSSKRRPTALEREALATSTCRRRSSNTRKKKEEEKEEHQPSLFLFFLSLPSLSLSLSLILFPQLTWGYASSVLHPAHTSWDCGPPVMMMEREREVKKRRKKISVDRLEKKRPASSRSPFSPCFQFPSAPSTYRPSPKPRPYNRVGS